MGEICGRHSVRVVALNAWQMVRERPLVYVEGTKNIEAHRPYEIEIPPVLRALLAVRPGAAILMETSVDPEIVALTGIPLRQTINEATWESGDAALNAPAAHAAIVLAFDGDPVDLAVKAHPEGLTGGGPLRRQGPAFRERFTSPILRLVQPQQPASRQ